MTEAIINFFSNLFNNDYLTTFFIAFLPIVELRGAIPVAIEVGLPWYTAFPVAYLGSIIIVPILLLLLKPVLNLLKRIKFFASFANAIEGMFQDKAKAIAAKAGGKDSERREEWIKIIGVFIFVALPIPLTGVWTGSAVAVFLGLKFWKALPAILLGNLTAGTIVLLLSIFLKEYLDTILNVFFILVILILALFIIKVVIRMVKQKKAKKAEEAAKLEDENASEDTSSGSTDEKGDKSDGNGVVYGRNIANEGDSDNLSDADTLADADKPIENTVAAESDISDSNKAK